MAATTRKRTSKKNPPAPIAIDMAGLHNAIRDAHYAQEDRAYMGLNEAVSKGMSLGGGPDDFMRQMVAYTVYKAAEHVLRIEDSVRLNPKADPALLAADVAIAKNQYVKALTAARKTLGGLPLGSWAAAVSRRHNFVGDNDRPVCQFCRLRWRRVRDTGTDEKFTLYALPGSRVWSTEKPSCISRMGVKPESGGTW